MAWARLGRRRAPARAAARRGSSARAGRRSDAVEAARARPLPAAVAARRASARRPPAGAGDGPQRRQRVVGDLAGPHEVPQRGEQLVVGGARRGRLAAGSRSSPRARRAPPRIASCSAPSGRSCASHPGASSGSWSAKHEPHPAVGRADRPGADPHDVAGRAQLVELRRAVVGDPRREHVGLERRGDERRAGQQAERLDDGVDAAPLRRHAVPRRQEPGQRLRLDRLDLAAQRGQRAPAQLAQHLDVAPLAAHALGAELAAHDPLVGLQRGERADDARLGQAEAVGDLALGERAVGAGVAGRRGPPAGAAPAR